MTYYSQFTGPFSPFPIPPSVIVTVPATDNTIDIGAPTKRYKAEYVVTVHTTDVETSTLTASTSITTPAITLNGVDLATEINAKADGPGSSVAGNIATWADAGGENLADSGVAPSSFLLKSGGTMTGDLDMAGFQLSNLNNVTGVVGAINFQSTLDMNTHNIDHVQTLTATTSVVTPAITLNGSDLTTELNGFLPTTGATAMTGNLDMGGHAVTNATELTFSNNNVTIGGGSNAFVFNNIAIGPGANTTDIHGTAIGPSATAGGNSSNTVGFNSGGAGSNQTIMGSDCSCDNSQYACCFGNHAESKAFAAITISSGNDTVTNSTGNSVLFGDDNIVNLRAANTTCDLGTTAAPFQFVYSKGIKVTQGANALSGTGAVLVGGTVTVPTTAVSTGDTILLSRTALIGPPGVVYISNITNGVSFDITSSSALDVSHFAWVIVKPT